MVVQLCEYTLKRPNSILCELNLSKAVIKKSHPYEFLGHGENPSVELESIQLSFEETCFHIFLPANIK